MPAAEQLAQLNQDIDEKKQRLWAALKAFHDARDSGQCHDAQVNLFRQCIGRETDLFNCIENCIARSELCGATRNDFWAQDLANTASNALDTLLQLYEKELWPQADRLGQRKPQPSRNAYSAMQNAVLLYNPDQAKEFESKFRALGLPVRGFTHPAAMNQMALWEKITAWATPILFLVALMAIAVFKTNYPRESFFILRVVLALIAAAFGAVAIPGFLAVQFKCRKSFIVRATGAVGLFAIVYFMNPPRLV